MAEHGDMIHSTASHDQRVGTGGTHTVNANAKNYNLKFFTASCSATLWRLHIGYDSKTHRHSKPITANARAACALGRGRLANLRRSCAAGPPAMPADVNVGDPQAT